MKTLNSDKQSLIHAESCFIVFAFSLEFKRFVIFLDKMEKEQEPSTSSSRQEVQEPSTSSGRPTRNKKANSLYADFVSIPLIDHRRPKNSTKNSAQWYDLNGYLFLTKALMKMKRVPAKNAVFFSSTLIFAP